MGTGLFRRQKDIVIRSAAALTTSYVASDSITIGGGDQVQLRVAFTLGSSDGCRIKIELSDDDTNWYQESGVDYSGGLEATRRPIIQKLIEDATIVISIPICAEYLRVSAQAITTGTGTSLEIRGRITNL